jgi:MoxR-like ATPase
MSATKDVTPEEFKRVFTDAREAIGRAVVGHAEVVEQILICLFADGHGLLEGVPGIGKTLLVRSLSSALELPFSRIQFTPDLMPADITGTDLVVEKPGGGLEMEFREGPVFGSVVLADEINRATPKTQSAMLQAMEEGQVSVARHTYQLPRPFFVLATQNPLDMEGTYPLPEAQLDRFMLKIQVGAPDLEDLLTIVDRTTGATTPNVPCVTDGPTVRGMQALIREVVLAPHLREFLGRLVLATHPDKSDAPALVQRVIRCGASPRAARSLALGAKTRALAAGRANVAEEDIRSLATSVLRHRLLLNFEGEAEGLSTVDVIADVLANVKA